MAAVAIARLLEALPRRCRSCRHLSFARHSSSLINIHDLQEPSTKPEITIEQVRSDQHPSAIELIKKYYFPEHVLVRARNMDLKDDCALDEYIVSLIKQGNTIYAKTEDGQMAGICIGYASTPAEVTNLRSYAFYRQDPNTRDFLFFTAKLQETPNLWKFFNQPKIFEMRMLCVAPEYRKQGIASALVECAKTQAQDQGYNVIRMNCINPHDYKVAERCMLRCILKFPLHRLRGSHTPFVTRSSPHNCFVKVYVDTKADSDIPDFNTIKKRQRDLEAMIE